MKKHNRSFLKNEGMLTKEAVNKLKYRMNQMVIVGTELETQNPDATAFEKLKKELKPTNNYYAVPDNLVVNVVKDGSLHGRGSAEVIMIGDTMSFEETRDKYALVETNLKNLGYYADGECGQHTSLLTIKPVRLPGVIFKNLFQLTKLYCAEIARLTSTGTNNNVERPIIRTNASRFANWNFKNTTAIGKNSKALIQLGNVENQHNGKYGYFNIYKSHTIPPDNIDVGEFFVEFRIPDRCVIPSITASWNFLFKAMFLKAITISQSGLLTFTNAEWTEKKTELDNIFNQSVKQIESDKSFQRTTEEFLDFLEPEFEYMGANKAYKILKFMVNKPLWGSEMIVTKEKLKEIEQKNCKEDYRVDYEKYLKEVICEEEELQKESPAESKIKDELLLGVEAENEDELISFLAEKTSYTNETISKYLKEFKTKNLMKKERIFMLRG